MKIKILQLQNHGDERGSLVAIEESKDIPFAIKRVYYMFNTDGSVRRGYHAHHELMQVAVVVKGTCRFLLDDGIEKVETILDSPSEGLMLEPYIWHEMYDFSDDCVLVVVASDYYKESDYIRNYQCFLDEVSR